MAVGSYYERNREAAKARAYYHANREARLAKVAEYREKNRDDAINAQLREYAKTDRRKACKKAERARNADKYRAHKEKYYKANRETVKARSRAWNAANPERAAARRKDYFQRHREHLMEARREWKRQNRARVYEACARRRALKRATAVERVDFAAVVAAWDGLCGICGEVVDGQYHFDHRVPLAAGGTHTADNIQIAHPLCNLKKGAKAS
jgi:hypothetical protein